MSKLAQKIATAPTTTINPVRRGPVGQCYATYGIGDLEDWEQVEAYRVGRTWADVQVHIDALIGVQRPLVLTKFRYHWRRRCYCWPEDLRR